MAKNLLKKYNEKRDFCITSEPSGTMVQKRDSDLMFVVQKHDATRLHYDFRLEWNGVLLSWAIPKGPSYYPENKRLAVRTEDHPISYGDFEGIIPEKQYGAGPVMVWDTGTWEPLEKDMDATLKKGKFSFRMFGEKLHGEWTLIRMRTKGKRDNWLLVKNKDKDAVDHEDKSFLKKTDYSVKTGRAFSEIANGLTKKKSVPSAVKISDLEKKYKTVQLATLIDKTPTGQNWIHEVKYDGYRILVFFSNGKVKIKTRNGHDWTDRFPVLKKAFEKLEVGNFVIDGEAVMINSAGLSDFKMLQNALSDSKAKMRGYFFDCLYWNGKDYSKEGFEARRQILEKLFKQIPEGSLLISEALDGPADKIIDKACDLDLEGIISKRKDAPYSFGRSKTWLKSKCESRQEFIICGYIPASDMPKAIGALHLGYYKNKKLTYAGKVGTGFNTKSAHMLYTKLQKIKTDQVPFAEKPKGINSKTIWTKPELLCEVKFGSWTKTGKLRHSSYQGLRLDKDPEKIKKEKPKHLSESKKETMLDKTVKSVRISNVDREIFPEAKITKGELAEFYAEMSDLIVPHTKNRPLSVVRCPGGIDKKCFFQRSKGKGMPGHIYKIDIKHNNKTHDYLYVKNIKGLIELVQMGSIEMHPWQAKVDKIEKPDRIIFDLDPDKNIPFEAIKLAAQDIKNRLEDLGLQSFLKCTGGKGLHISSPITRTQDFETVKNFTKSFAHKMESDTPQAYTTNMSKTKRKGKIFIDYLRNDFASTAVMDYCVRARPGGAVAVPLLWDELDGLQSANQFSLQDARNRKKTGAKILKEWNNIRQSLTKDMLSIFKGE